MYSKLSTQAVILKVDDVGERDVSVSLFTREFGFLYAKATGVRTMSSRLRFALQSMSLGFVSLVHGKAGWILTNATFLKSYYFDSAEYTQKQIINKILILIGRLYIGEEAHPELFDFIEEKLEMLSSEAIRTEEMKSLEVFIVFKILEKLGYVEDHATLKPLSKTDDYTESLSVYIIENQKLITPFINSAIRTSGL